MNKTLDKIVAYLINKEIISPDQEEVYRYGYFIVFEIGINILISLIVGITLQDLGGVIFFLCLYIPLRSNCGGWHAPKLWLCTLLSNALLVVVIMIKEYFTDICSFPVLWSILLICIGLISWLAPVDSEAKRLSREEKNYIRKKIKVILVLHMGISGYLSLVQIKPYMLLVVCAYVTLVILLLLELMRKKID